MAVSKKRKIEEVKKEEVKNILSHDEHLAIEKLPLVVENSKLLMALEEQSLANMLLEEKILGIKIEKQRIRVNEYHLKYNQEKSRYSLIVGDIMENHGLKNDKFGYDPDTREIKI